MCRWHLGYLIAALAGIAGPGCHDLPYQYGRFQTSPPQEVVVRYGEPGPRLQRARRFVSAPARLFHLPERKTPSPETLDKVKAYLRQNDLTDVPVFVNCYEPHFGEQWRRLRENQSIAAGWRYTAGALGVLGYTLLPGPVFRRDSYQQRYTSEHDQPECRRSGHRPVGRCGREGSARAKNARHIPGRQQSAGGRPLAAMPDCV